MDYIHYHIISYSESLISWSGLYISRIKHRYISITISFFYFTCKIKVCTIYSKINHQRMNFFKRDPWRFPLQQEQFPQKKLFLHAVLNCQDVFTSRTATESGKLRYACWDSIAKPSFPVTYSSTTERSFVGLMNSKSALKYFFYTSC